MKKVTDLNILKKEDVSFFTSSKGSLSKFQLYGMTLLEIVNLVQKGELFYQDSY